ncbi:MAG: ASPIC/UnbV domain-containing protein, partial [bacterium]
NDGSLDLYVANESSFSSPGFPNVLYRNLGNGSFGLLEDGAGTANQLGSYGSACADINNDGSLDLFVTNNNDPDQLFLNSGSSNNWLKVQLVGTISNRDAVGARLRVVAEDLQSFSEISAGGGYVSQNSLLQHFGLGHRTVIDTLAIRWPSGTYEEYTNIPANQQVTITEREGIVTGVHSETLTENIPLGFSLSPNYPNPFNPSTTIGFTIGGQESHPTKIVVYDLHGKLITTLLDESLLPGEYFVQWRGRDYFGESVSSGIYFVKMITANHTGTRKLTLLK